MANYIRGWGARGLLTVPLIGSPALLYPQRLLVAYAAGDTREGKQKNEQKEEEDNDEVVGMGCFVLVCLLSLGYLCALAVLLYYVATQGEFEVGGLEGGPLPHSGAYDCAYPKLRH